MRLSWLLIALASLRGSLAHPLKLAASGPAAPAAAAANKNENQAALRGAARPRQEQHEPEQEKQQVMKTKTSLALSPTALPDIDVDDYDYGFVEDVDVDDYDQTSAMASMERHIEFWQGRLSEPALERALAARLAGMDAEARRVWEARVPKSLLSSSAESLDDWLNLHDVGDVAASKGTNNSSTSNSSSHSSTSNSSSSNSSVAAAVPEGHEVEAAQEWWNKVFSSDSGTGSFAIWLLAMTAESRTEWEGRVSQLVVADGGEQWTPAWQPALAKTIAQLKALGDPDSDLEQRLSFADKSDEEGSNDHDVELDLASPDQSLASIALLASRWWVQDKWNGHSHAH